MKHKIRDSFVWFVSVIGVTVLYRAHKRKQGPLVRVLCFHDVADKDWFENVVKLCKNKCNLLTPKQFQAKDFDTEKINILLTFDDGYQSWIDNCMSVMKKYDVKGLFFINSGLLDIAEDKEMVAVYMRDNLQVAPKIPLTWKGAKSLVHDGHTVGGHTSNHYDLANLSTEELKKEIQQDKNQIESKLYIELHDFAYPFGTPKHYNQNIKNEIVAIGYVSAYTAWSSFVGNEVKYIPRTLIERHQSVVSISRWIEGGYDIFTLFKRLV